MLTASPDMPSLLMVPGFSHSSLAAWQHRSDCMIMGHLDQGAASTACTACIMRMSIQHMLLLMQICT
jgi:hypothetical protein